MVHARKLCELNHLLFGCFLVDYSIPFPCRMVGAPVLSNSGNARKVLVYWDMGISLRFVCLSLFTQ
jgi:hypothetical protein